MSKGNRERLERAEAKRVAQAKKSTILPLSGRARSMNERDLIQRLRAKLPGIQTPMMNGDNLAVTLCSHFDNPDQPNDDEHGWSEDAVRGQYEVLDAIHAHYAATIASLSEALAEAEKKGAEDEGALAKAIFQADYPTDKWERFARGDVVDERYRLLARAALAHIFPPRDLSQGGQHG